MISRIIARPNQYRYSQPQDFPWRPMDNREKRAAWAVRYYQKFKPFEHPAKDQANA